MAHTIRLFLVDDHSLFRESLARLLEAEDGLQLAGSFSSAAEAMQALRKDAAGLVLVDLVLLDFDLGERQGLDFLEAARAARLSTRILMVTAGMSDADTLRALELGACGIFLKHSPPAELIAAIHKVAAGEIWLDSRAVRSVVNAAAKGKAQAQPQEHISLNQREQAVLKAVFEGLTNKEIAARLDISESYVKAVLQQLFDKTGVRTRGQLVRIALERRLEYGLILDPEG